MMKKKRLMLIMTVFLALLMLASVSYANAASKDKEKSEKSEESTAEEPLREVHKVGVGEKTYCFFVTKNVVLTPAEIAEMNDEELTAWIIDCSGFYMKETNCKVESHKAITAAAWRENGGRFLLSDDDIANIRALEPVDGDPYKLYMDLMVSDKPAPEDPDEGYQDEVYSTYKKVSPSLLFLVVATEADAATPEDICKAPARKPEKQVSLPKPKNSGDMLPEYRTIKMADRSGKPIEDTLQDGTPVSLEWIEPSKSSPESRSFIDRIPGGYLGLAAILAAAALIVVLIIKKRVDDRDQ